MVSEHVWSQEQIAAYLAGGLSSEECERLDRHAKECPECAAALTAAQHLDRGLGTLFFPLRPKPGLEDRAILAVRVAPKPNAIFFIGWPRRVTAVAAAVIALATFGALTASMMNDGRLPVPGEIAATDGCKSPFETQRNARTKRG
jgi:anti-sigma factor RsiW